MKYKNLILVGTSHIAKEALIKVESTLQRENPDIVCLELDNNRLYGLMHEKKEKMRLRDIKKYGAKGYAFAKFGEWAESKLGDMVGVKPGSEMLIGEKYARLNRRRLELIDQDIGITLQRFSKTLTWREKWRFFVDFIKAAILRKKDVEFDLNTVPSQQVINKMITKVKKRYPNVYKVLIKERNYYMARRLEHLMRLYPEKKIVAIIGAGHEEEIIDIIKKIEKGLVTYV